MLLFNHADTIKEDRLDFGTAVLDPTPLSMIPLEFLTSVPRRSILVSTLVHSKQRFVTCGTQVCFRIAPTATVMRAALRSIMQRLGHCMTAWSMSLVIRTLIWCPRATLKGLMFTLKCSVCRCSSPAAAVVACLQGDRSTARRIWRHSCAGSTATI